MKREELVGTGYGRPKPNYIKELVEVDAGTPMGEYFRRFWHPIAIAREVTDTPQKARLLGEDLVVFRDKRGRIGVVVEHCTHRQASLYYGRIEEDGIRCGYHGWLFDVQGRCVEQAIEPGGGAARSKVRQPWYPVQEQYGIVFVYMGPPAEMPLLPRYGVLEGLSDDEVLATTWDSMPGATHPLLPCNWLVDMDNIHDMGHAMWLHELHSGPQFGPTFSFVTKENAAAISQSFEYTETPHGIYNRFEMPLPDGAIVSVTSEHHLPLLRILHPPFLIGPLGSIFNWCVPVDNVSHRVLTLMRVSKSADVLPNPMADWDRSDPAAVRAKPSDNEMQNSQGPIQMHSREHLASSDRGVVKMRRQYQRELAKLAAGEPLANVIHPPGDALLPVVAGATLVKAAPEEAVLVSNDSSVRDSSQWQVTMKTPMGNESLRFDLTVEGGAVQGSVINDRETCAVTDGVADGRTLRWKIRLTKPIGLKVTFNAVIDGPTISGTGKTMFGTSSFAGERL